MKNKAIITLPKKRYNNRIPNLYDSLPDKEINNICKLLAIKKYEKKADNKRGNGRYITIDINNKRIFVAISPSEEGGRNSFIQTLPTSYRAYLLDATNKKYFVYYFLDLGKTLTADYHKLVFRLVVSLDIKILNKERAFGNYRIDKFNNIRDIINERELLSKRNSYNESSYITDEGDKYHIYGKTFGANGKVTTLICYTLEKLTDKPIELFFIRDNEAISISDEDKNILTNNGIISIHDEIYDIEQDEDSYYSGNSNNLRSGTYIYNLLRKFGKKECALCDCEIESIIQGAHIWSVSDIKKSNLDIEDKKLNATNKDNGIWLCQNHHKLFDANIITINNDGVIEYNPNISTNNKQYLTHTTKNKLKIELNNKMKEYFNKRYKR